MGLSESGNSYALHDFGEVVLDGVALSGTQLRKAYTFYGLQKHRGISYDQQRDNAIIEALMQPQHLAITPSEAKENDLEPSQSKLVASAPAAPATANELELSQSELAATAPAIPATANELELQLSILPERNETSVAKSA